MSFKEFINESTDTVKLDDHLKAAITKELHNGYFGAEHRHVIKIKKINDGKYYALVGHHVDEHQVSLSNIKGLKVGDEIFEVFELDCIDHHDIGVVDILPGPHNSGGIFTKKSDAESYLRSLT